MTLPKTLPEMRPAWIEAVWELVAAVDAAEAGENGQPAMELSWPGPSPLRLLALALGGPDNEAWSRCAFELCELYDRARAAELRLERERATMREVLAKLDAAIEASKAIERNPAT